jgi:acyl-CoA synthetase (AMP-forming)/AMP-acid ligase II
MLQAVVRFGDHHPVDRASRSAVPKEAPAASSNWPAPRAGLRHRPVQRDLSLLLYTSGTMGRPKGVPRRQRAERAVALAHLAQNLYCRGERTLGVMPLYHTMGVRSLLAMAIVDGAFICQRQFDAAAALRHIARERITSLYLVPTLYHGSGRPPRFRCLRHQLGHEARLCGRGDAGTAC